MAEAAAPTYKVPGCMVLARLSTRETALVYHGESRAAVCQMLLDGFQMCGWVLVLPGDNRVRLFRPRPGFEAFCEAAKRQYMAAVARQHLQDANA